MPDRLKIFNVTWSTQSGGPSNDNNNRTELYLMGCNRANKGNPCSGCFNDALWSTSDCMETHSPAEVANQIQKYAPNKNVTIVGGEPTDQMKGLTELCRLLKLRGFHIILFSWRTMQMLQSSKKRRDDWGKILANIDIFIDGEYDESKHIYNDDIQDGFHNAVGSGNQIVWDIKKRNDNNDSAIFGYHAENIKSLFINSNNDLIYILQNNSCKETIAFQLKEENDDKKNRQL